MKLPFRDYSDFIAEHIDGKVQKLAVDAGFTCPNRDGTKGMGGCIYCTNKAFNPKYCDARMSVTRQLQAGKQFFAGKYAHVRYLAYFQAHTNTHAPLEKLKALYAEALSVDGVVGLVIATRPDCVSNEILDYLAMLSANAFVMIEYGIETLNDVTLEKINRCHDAGTAVAAIKATAQRNIPVGAHLIFGLPGETEAHMMSSVDRLVSLPISTIKFHQLQVLRGTRLACDYSQVRLWTPCEYARFCAKVLAHIPSHIAIDRFVSESPSSMLIAPKWGVKPAEFQKLLLSHLSQNKYRDI